MPRGRKPYALKQASALAQLRIDAGLTQATAAEKLELEVASLGNIERGTASASDDVLERMSKAYDASLPRVRKAHRLTRLRHIDRVKEGL